MNEQQNLLGRHQLKQTRRGKYTRFHERTAELTLKTFRKYFSFIILFHCYCKPQHCLSLVNIMSLYMLSLFRLSLMRTVRMALASEDKSHSPSYLLIGRTAFFLSDLLMHLPGWNGGTGKTQTIRVC